MAGPSISDLILDCIDAIDHIRDHAHELGVDPKRLVAIGDSAGAHLAASLGTIAPDRSKVNAVVACSSISDLSYNFGRDHIKPSPSLEKKKMEDDPDRLKKAKAASPIFHLSPKTPPFLIIDGKMDWLKDEPLRFKKALLNANVETTYLSYPNYKHAFIVYNYSAPIDQITQTLLDIDEFMVKKGFLEGKSQLALPIHYKKTGLNLSFDETFRESYTITEEDDFPPFMRIAFELHLPKTFKGTLLELKDKFGFQWKVDQKNQYFKAIRMRNRQKQNLFLAGEWNTVELVLGPKSVVMKINDQTIEFENPIEQSFIGSELKFGVIKNAQFKNITIKEL
jgi:dienelactone hydrolase